MSQLIDCYATLQIEAGADRAQVTAAYRRLSKLFHPDVNGSPGAEAMMKRINAAYHILKDEERRREYDLKYGFRRPQFTASAAAYSEAAASFAAQAARQGSFAASEADERETAARAQRSPEAAGAVMADYLEHLRTGEYEKAYELLCLHDRQYVTLQSFCKWRQSVQKLFAMRDFDIRHGEDVPNFRMDEGSYAQARKLYINITEKNFAQGTVDSYQFIKHTVLEYGKWRVFLGYRDLGEIAKIFEDLSRRQEQGEMARRWEEYCRHTCRGLDMLSLEGLIHEARRELYRCRRYGQDMTVALISVRPQGRRITEEALADVVEITAGTLAACLRETDIPAYLGDGVFAVLFVEMRRKHARAILARMAEGMRKAILERCGRPVAPRFVFAPYEGGALQGYIDTLASQLQRGQSF